MSPFLWRRAYYSAPGRQQRLRQPVISVGNISMGGRGKTPIVAEVARRLVAAGERPAILSRGYGRRVTADGVVVVSDGARVLADLDRAGDEPLLLAHSVPGAIVVVNDSRQLAGALAERSLGATVHLLDDGFQHLQLARDLDLVSIAPEDLRDRPAPFGRLREPVAALADADALVIDGEPPAAGGPAATPMFTLRRTLGTPVPIEADRFGPIAAGTAVSSVAGIARPERFRDALVAAGWTVAAQTTFGDHHRYRAADVDRIGSAARAAGAGVVLTTEKDAMRLRPFRPLPIAIYSVPLVVDLLPAAEFDRWLSAGLEASRS
ncbi:MAG TPA: tetraacyldisaccharide 4'-kinase [Vicinamibacterales bacterium]|nr:tetraacyldisaccharide 4'-kinase [Vicinamibacterales bacterium]